MTVLSDIRLLVRRDLKDEDSSAYRWTDNEVDRHIARALRELSLNIPLYVKTTVATVAGSRDIALASGTFGNRTSVEAIEWPQGQWPRAFVGFEVNGDTVTIHGPRVPDGSNCSVHWSKLHTLDGSGSTLLVALEDVLVDGATAYAALAWSSLATNRINLGGPQAQRDYERWARERLEDFRDALAVYGRRGRIRTSRLYVPVDDDAAIGNLEVTDPGPL